MPFYIAPVAWECCGTGRRHAALQAAHDRRALVGGKVESRPLADTVEESVQIAAIARGWNAVGAADEISEEGTDRFQVGDDVDRGRRDRERHPGIGRRIGVLDDDRAAMGFDRLRAGGAIGPGASEDDGDQFVAEGASGGR
jgi:hypothetical protein